MVPLIRATMPSSAPMAFVTGTSMVSIQPEAPEAIGLPLLIFNNKGISKTVKKSLDTFTIKP